MSSRLVPRLVLVGLLAVSSAAPVVAQEGGFIVPLVGEPLPPASKPGCGLGDCCRMPAAAVTIIGVKVQRVQQRPDLRQFAQYDVTGLGCVKEPPVQSGPRLIVVGQECQAPQAVQMPLAVCGTPVLQPCVPAPSAIPATLPTCTPPVLRLKCDGPPDSMKQMAVDVFGELLVQSGVSAPQFVPPPQVLPAAAQAKPNMIGTWYRDLGKRRCVVEVAADHMTFTVTDSYDDGDKSMSMQCIITAEYHMTRDGTTAVGLITSVDFRLEGDTSEVEESNDLADVVAKMQQAMEDKPFAMTCRVLGDSLVIGNVRMPLLEGQDDQPAKCIGGRYTSVGNKPMPKVKTTKGKVFSEYSTDNLRMQQIPSPPSEGPVTPTSGVQGLPGMIPTVIPASETTPPMMVPPEPPVPMMEPPTPPSFSANEEAGPVKTAQKRFTIPSLPPVGFRFDPDVPIVKGSGDHKQIFQFSIDLFRDDEAPTTPPTVPPMPTPPSGGALTTPPSNGTSSNTTSKGSALRNVMTAKPNTDHKQIFNFPMGLFGSQ